MEGKSISSEGWPCEKCNNEDPKWINRKTNIPREGDYEKECYYCGNIKQTASNKETLKEIRKKEYLLQGSGNKAFCGRCMMIREMLIEKGPTIIQGWMIRECVECGKRHDFRIGITSI